MSFRVIVTGDRGWYCHRLARYILGRLSNNHGDALVIVHGACRTGVDQVFDEEAENIDVTTERHPADWDVHGKASGPIRNQEMVDLGAKFCLALHRDLMASRGTLDCVRRCLQAGIPVWLVDSEAEDAGARRITSEDLKRAKP